jgi:6-pyruvoyltetrahydropterin/6-carboxytetrahydropterin synthase
MYRSTKTYGHDVGLSACFRQWRATHSHCSKLHGYALSVHLEFEAEELDALNWVVDFGGLKDIKAWLQDTFDHKTLVAEDDPDMHAFKVAHSAGVIDMVIVSATGCEKFAEMVYNHVSSWLAREGLADRVRLTRARVSEHGANSASYWR